MDPGDCDGYVPVTQQRADLANVVAGLLQAWFGSNLSGQFLQWRVVAVDGQFVKLQDDDGRLWEIRVSRTRDWVGV